MPVVAVMMGVSLSQELRQRVWDSIHIYAIRLLATQLCAQVVHSWKDQLVRSICRVNSQHLPSAQLHSPRLSNQGRCGAVGFDSAVTKEVDSAES
jgi:hypothetical protein